MRPISTGLKPRLRARRTGFRKFSGLVIAVNVDMWRLVWFVTVRVHTVWARSQNSRHATSISSLRAACPSRSAAHLYADRLFLLAARREFRDENRVFELTYVLISSPFAPPLGRALSSRDANRAASPSPIASLRAAPHCDTVSTHGWGTSRLALAVLLHVDSPNCGLTLIVSNVF